MRQIILGTALLLLLTKCSQKENVSCQTFKITNDKAETIRTKNVQINIPPNSFVFIDGQEVKGTIQFQLKEIFKKSEMISNNLGTVSDGRLLESFGMFDLKATSENKELKIKEGKSIQIFIADKKGDLSGQLFYGSQVDGILNWDYDSISNIQTDEINTLYKYNLTKLGLINCDRFIDIANKVNLEIELKKYNRPVGYIVFSKINSVMITLFDKNGKATINNLPSDYIIDVVVIDKVDNDIMWYKKNLKIGTENNLSLETGKISSEEFKRELNKLDD